MVFPRTTLVYVELAMAVCNFALVETVTAPTELPTNAKHPETKAAMPARHARRRPVVLLMCSSPASRRTEGTYQPRRSPQRTPEGNRQSRARRRRARRPRAELSASSSGTTLHERLSY